jgi:hypothetical protein
MLSNPISTLRCDVFPHSASGRFGESHQSELHLSHSKCMKSRVLHKDGPYRKGRAICFLPSLAEGDEGNWRQLALKGTRQHTMPVGEFMDRDLRPTGRTKSVHSIPQSLWLKAVLVSGPQRGAQHGETVRSAHTLPHSKLCTVRQPRDCHV